jgi:D-sedoheptulose 7-phosphate isomerase
MKEYIKSQLLESAEIKRVLADRYLDTIVEIVNACVKSLADGGTVMFCGNGGSAADSQHLAAELVVRLTGDYDRQALPAIALTTDTSILTACANDYGFNRIFARQVEALGRPGDVLVAISTSGNSDNVLNAAKSAKDRNMIVIGFAGGDGGKLADSADIALVVPSNDVQRIQESHITIGHILIGLIEREIIANAG